jgi:3-oxoacyl-[acyl-carrier-protein] synthase III
MTARLHVVGGGAVTPVGLNAPQTCAGIRAKVSRFEEVLRTSPFGRTQVVARIPAHWSLRRTPAEWLVNLAARAVKEVVERHHVTARETALIVIPPEHFRQAFFLDLATMNTLAESISARAGMQFESTCQVSEGGAASIVSALDLAAHWAGTGKVRQVILGGVDSYVLDAEYTRLDAAGRLRTEGTAQGFTPGEAAAFVLLSAEPVTHADTSAAILGWGEAAEPLSARSKSYSQGRGMVAALRGAAARSATEEAAIDWVISNANGERYASWESVLARARFYRTRRERLPTTLPAMSLGEIGSAGGTLALLVVAHGFSRRYRPGSTAMIELSSEGEGRAACLVAAVSERAFHVSPIARTEDAFERGALYRE